MHIYVSSLQLANRYLNNDYEKKIGSVISITDPYGVYGNFDISKGVEDPPEKIHEYNYLRLYMHDINEINKNLIYPCEKHVRDLLDFAKSIDYNKNIVVHCSAGVSRSSAIALAVALHKNRDIKNAYRCIYRYNKSILPNQLLIEIIDDVLELKGNLIDFSHVIKNSIYKQYEIKKRQGKTIF